MQVNNHRTPEHPAAFDAMAKIPTLAEAAWYLSARLNQKLLVSSATSQKMGGLTISHKINLELATERGHQSKIICKIIESCPNEFRQAKLLRSPHC